MTTIIGNYFPHVQELGKRFEITVGDGLVDDKTIKDDHTCL